MEQNTKTQTPALAPEEILAAVYRHPDNEGDTSVWARPVVTGTTEDGYTVARMETLDGRIFDEILYVKKGEARGTYEIVVPEDV